MKIIFDLRSVGLGNNGGSSTLIKSANTLVDLGHQVMFIDNMKNMHTWTPLKAEHIIRKNNKAKLPPADIIIATGFKSVRHTIRAPKQCGVRGHWIRGWETWQMSETNIIKRILRASTKKFVNSIGLQKKLYSHDTDSYIVRPGYDLHELYPTGARDKRNKFIIGALYTTGKHVAIKRYGWVLEVAKYMKGKYPNIELWMMGTSHTPEQADKYYRQPTIKEKNEFYNGVDVWLSPSKQEGLHMPPAEAMLTGCPVVGNDTILSGTKDYLIDKVSGFVSKNDYNDFRDCVERIYLNKVLRITMGNEARKCIEAIGSREKNMKYFVDLIETMIGYKKEVTI